MATAAPRSAGMRSTFRVHNAEKERAMLGHYVFNASAIGLGGVLTSPKRKVIPSLASVALAPTGGEGSSIVTNYDDGDGISFDRAETRVWGSSHSGNIYATRADVMV